MNKSKNSQAANQPNKLQRRLEALLAIAAILLIPLLFASCATKPTPVASATAVPSQPPTQASTEIPIIAPTAALSTAVPVVANGQEPPPCTFPLAQITTTQSAPENYTFSEPKVVLTAPKGDYYDIDEWLPDNKQVLITEDLLSGFVETYKSSPQEYISLYNPETGASKVIAIRPETNEPPLWNPALNAVIYPVDNFLGLDQSTHSLNSTLQVWVSYGNAATAQKLDDNLPQLLLAVKPGGGETLYLADKQINELDAL